MSKAEISEFDKATEAVNAIRAGVPEELSHPRVAIILGTGLGGLADTLDQQSKVEIPYGEIPNFRQSTVAGHSGKLILGYMGERKVPVVCMAGRLHTYEGFDIKDTVLPVRVFNLLGVQTLVATNAAGGLNQSYKVGDIMLLDDHINLPGLSGLHPLKGPNDERFGERFTALSDAYDLELRAKFFQTADELKITRSIHEGTYAYVSGPSYETRAECRFLIAGGADAVGMSTVPETVTARHGGMRVLALSLITNVSVIEKVKSAREVQAKSLSEGKANHEEVLEAGKEAAKDIQSIVARFVGGL